MSKILLHQINFTSKDEKRRKTIPGSAGCIRDKRSSRLIHVSWQTNKLYKPRNFVSRDKNGMHAWWIQRESFTRHNYSRRKQTESDYEIWIFIYPPFKKHLGFRERLPATRKYPPRSIKSAWQDSSFMARGVMAEGTAGRRLVSKVFRERPIHAKTVYIMIHWTAKQAPRIEDTDVICGVTGWLSYVKRTVLPILAGSFDGRKS